MKFIKLNCRIHVRSFSVNEYLSSSQNMHDHIFIWWTMKGHLKYVNSFLEYIYVINQIYQQLKLK